MGRAVEDAETDLEEHLCEIRTKSCRKYCRAVKERENGKRRFKLMKGFRNVVKRLSTTKSALPKLNWDNDDDVESGGPEPQPVPSEDQGWAI